MEAISGGSGPRTSAVARKIDRESMRPRIPPQVRLGGRVHTEGFFARRPTRIERRVTAAPGNALTDLRTFQYTTRSYVPGATEVLVASVAETMTEGGATTKSHVLTTEYDAFANPFRMTKTSIVGELFATMTEQTQFAHRNDEVRWILGQPEVVLHTSEVSDAAAIAPQVPRSRVVRRFEVDEATGLTRAVAIQEGAGDSQELRREFTRDLHGQIIATRELDRRGNTRQTEIRWDKLDGTYPASMTDASGLTSRVQYHSGLGVVVATESPNGVLQRFRYDGFGRLRAELSPTCTTGGCPAVERDRLISYAGATTGKPGALVATVVTQPGAPLLRNFVDSLGRVIRTESQLPDGRFAIRETSWHPDFWNAPAEERRAVTDAPTPAWQSSRYTYDRSGRPTRLDRDQADGIASMRWQYEANRVTTTSPTGAVTRVSVDGAGRIVRTERFDGLTKGKTAFDLTPKWMTTSIAYGPLSQPARVIDPGGNITRLTYDALGRRTSVLDSDSGLTTTAYDAFSNVVAERNALGLETEFRWDAAGRLVGRRSADGLACIAWDASPGGVGQVSSARYSPAAGDSVFGWNDYDALGRLTARHEQIGASAELAGHWSYDVRGRVRRMQYPNGVAVENEYSLVSGHLTGVVDDLGVPVWRATSNDLAGHFTGEIGGDGLAVTHEFDLLEDRLSRTIITDGAGGVRDELSFAWYRDGKLRSRVERFTTDDSLPRSVAKTEDYVYDAVKRLEKWSGSVLTTLPKGKSEKTDFAVTYAYDAIGNLSFRSTKGAPDEIFVSGSPADGQPPHAIVRGPTGDYRYDDAGRQIAAPGRTVAWTNFNKPIRVATDTEIVSYDYDASHTRVRKRAEDGRSTTYALDGMYEERVVDGARTEVATVATPGSIAAQIFRGPDGRRHTLFLHRDRLGSPYAITTESGAVVDRPAHEPFGRRVHATTPTSPDVAATAVTRGFTGHEHEDELGIVNMGGRIYDPAVGRFASPDPITTLSDPVSLNRFAYVNNDPINATDPSGFSANDAGGWNASFNPLGLLGLLFGFPGSGASPAPILGAGYTWGGSANPKRIAAAVPKMVPFVPIVTARVAVGGEGGTVERRVGLSPEFEASTREAFADLAKVQYHWYMRQRGWWTPEFDENEARNARVAITIGMVVTAPFWPAWLARGVMLGGAAYAAVSTPSHQSEEFGPAVVAMALPFARILPRVASPRVWGGSHRAVRASANEVGAGGEVHHMPSWAATEGAGVEVTEGGAPSIWMEKADHAGTASYGRSEAATLYRAEQRYLIESGRYLDALKMDVDSIRAAHGTKYDLGIQQMGAYVWTKFSL